MYESASARPTADRREKAETHGKRKYLECGDASPLLKHGPGQEPSCDASAHSKECKKSDNFKSGLDRM